MEKKVLEFKMVELREVTNKDGETRVMLKLFCESYIKSVTTLGDFSQENEGQLTYYLFVKEIPKDDKGKPKYELGIQKEPKVYELEHYYEGAGVWKPTGYNVVERKVALKDTGEEIKVKHLKSL